MNIQQAKTEISNTLRAYLHKGEDGRYTYPTVRQRPILLMGPPGIGKTAIMEQIAEECGVGLVAYTITHHTRQSAIGLPHIEERIFDGVKVSVTEYTLSEIVSSVYETMERTGNKEGILFLDEINCVSETLAPTMLQLLQNKTFGNHKVPDGWVIVAAGNPPEFNKSVREFDIVTLDRVRQIDVEADLSVWMDYARVRGVHGAILSYLTIKPDRFYMVEQQEEQMDFVTARGWEDLSALLKSYEAFGISVGMDQVIQFLHKDSVARDFAAYYALYCKYGMDYGVAELLAGDLSEEEYAQKTAMASGGGFEERFTVVNLVLEHLLVGCERYAWEDTLAVRLHSALQQLGKRLDKPASEEVLSEYIQAGWKALETKEKNGLLNGLEIRVEREMLKRLEEMELSVRGAHLREGEEILNSLREQFDIDLSRRSELVEALQEQLNRAFEWLSACFGDGQEMVLFVSSLTRSPRAMDYIGRHGCEPYLRYSEALLYQKREMELQQACKELLQ